MTADTSAQRLFDVFKEPVLALLLWTTVLTGKVNQSICRLLGVTELDIESLESIYGDELRALAALRVADSGSAELGRVLSSYVSGHLISALLNKSEKEMEHYSRMLARLPRWIREPEQTELERAARHEAATVRLLEAHARRDEVNLRRRETALKLQEQDRQRQTPATNAGDSQAAPTASTMQSAASGDPLSNSAQIEAAPVEAATVESASPAAADLQTIAGKSTALEPAAPEAAAHEPAALEAAAADAKTVSVVSSETPKVKSPRRNQAASGKQKQQPAKPRRLRIA